MKGQVDTTVHVMPFNPFTTVKMTRCRAKMPEYVQSVPLFDNEKKFVGFRYVQHKTPIRKF